MKRIAWNKKLPDFFTCEYCSKKFPNKYGHINRFCSHSCYASSNRGGIPPGGFKPGKQHWNYSGNPINRDGLRFNYPQMRELAKKSGYKCVICGFQFQNLPIYKVRNVMSFDHVVPIRLGGEHSIENGQLLCRPCNKLKTRFDKIKIFHITNKK